MQKTRLLSGNSWSGMWVKCWLHQNLKLSFPLAQKLEKSKTLCTLYQIFEHQNTFMEMHQPTGQHLGLKNYKDQFQESNRSQSWRVFCSPVISIQRICFWWQIEPILFHSYPVWFNYDTQNQSGQFQGHLFQEILTVDCCHWFTTTT